MAWQWCGLSSSSQTGVWACRAGARSSEPGPVDLVRGSSCTPRKSTCPGDPAVAAQESQPESHDLNNLCKWGLKNIAHGYETDCPAYLDCKVPPINVTTEGVLVFGWSVAREVMGYVPDRRSWCTPKWVAWIPASSPKEPKAREAHLINPFSPCQKLVSPQFLWSHLFIDAHTDLSTWERFHRSSPPPPTKHTRGQ